MRPQLRQKQREQLPLIEVTGELKSDGVPAHYVVLCDNRDTDHFLGQVLIFLCDHRECVRQQFQSFLVIISSLEVEVPSEGCRFLRDFLGTVT